MSFIQEIIEFSIKKAEEFGAVNEGDLVSYVFRNNTREDALRGGGAFFGFISPDEETQGPYHDLSLVIFPPENPDESWCGYPWFQE